MNLFRSVLAACAGLLCSAAISAAADYTITDLGTFGGATSYARSINNQGQVVGWYDNADRSRYSFLYDHGSVTQLGTLGGTSTTALSINNQGQIVGRSSGGFIFENGAMRGVMPNAPSFLPHAINDAGQIAGENFAARAVMFTNGTLVDLGAPAGPYGNNYSFAYGINNRGEVVGEYERPPGPSRNTDEDRAFLYSNGKFIDLGTLYGNAFLEVPWTDARDINDHGQIAGRGTIASGDMHAFLYSNGVMRDLGTIGNRASEANAINNLGDVVGELIETAADRHGFIYHDGRMSDLNDLIEPNSGWTVQWALDINDHGEIAGVGMRDGVSRGIILTPIPEPAALVLLPLYLLPLRRRRYVRCDCP